MIASATDFDRLIGRDLRVLHFYLAYAIGVVTAGAVLVLLSFTVGAGQGAADLMLRIGGGFVASLGALPIKEYLDRYNRISGLRAVREKWDELSCAPNVRA